MEKLLKRINELAAIQKTRSLSEEEKTEQIHLREKYLENFRAGFKDQLKSLKVVDQKGNDITPQKLKELKDKK
ncbi:DUF896 domain-containing protein [Spiroplasma culicicola]|uniref:Uncharacterized protein n=1 Tax=Spiroplasma culicicola AES-1 TaxID=1276246 RepID=W6A7P4_9MOLU|nr:DUF896 domain-containing protein [Spiroplasma culicicola]AHI52885.1 hypothetical protein SCULI_v1c05440 [Spiroplasma culicicola AES-1]